MPTIQTEKATLKRVRAIKDQYGLDSMNDALALLISEFTKPETRNVTTDIFDRQALALASRFNLGPYVNPVQPEVVDVRFDEPRATLFIGGWWLFLPITVSNPRSLPRVEIHDAASSGFLIRVITDHRFPGQAVCGFNGADHTYHVPGDEYEPAVLSMIETEGVAFLAPPGGNRFYDDDDRPIFGGFSGECWDHENSQPDCPTWGNMQTVPKYVSEALPELVQRRNDLIKNRRQRRRKEKQSVIEKLSEHGVDVQGLNPDNSSWSDLLETVPEEAEGEFPKNGPENSSTTTNLALPVRLAVKYHYIDQNESVVEFNGRTMTAATFISEVDADGPEVNVPPGDVLSVSEVAEAMYTTQPRLNPHGLDKQEWINAFDTDTVQPIPA